MHNVLRVARKEFHGFFASPAAFIFLGAFLGVTLFTFFWVERFFARNIADVRPLFEWMPMLLIFLVSAITMRMWSEERRSGTLELLLTSPVPPVQLVLGKFAACVALVAVALLLTLPLPISVAALGSLDWGPVAGGYVATLFLAAAYVAIGLFVSARSENAIVSLIVTAVIGSVLYLIGSDAVTGLFGNRVSEIFKLLGSGARFESITRGVLDLRDVYYYVSLVGVFLTLNVLVLEWLRWRGNPPSAEHRRWALLSALVVANFLVGNVWLARVGTARIDVTQGNIYSISDATRGYLQQLREPLLIRGYFSAQTHPLLSPLVPRLRDLLREYALAGGGKVRIEIIDPLENPDLEREAGEKFGIRPVPFQVSTKYQASVVNSYFDLVVQYGDEYETLGFRDLIDVKAESDTEIDVDLRNPEYDITRAVKKVLYAYQASGDPFESVDGAVTFKGYISPAEKLPPSLVAMRTDLESLVQDLAAKSQDKLLVELVDPEAGDGALAKQLTESFGFRPMLASLFDPRTFWFHMLLEGEGRVVQVPLPEEEGRAALERSVKAAVQRFSSSTLRTVALYTPQPPMTDPRLGPAPGPRFGALRETLEAEHAVRDVDLADGRVPAEADLLIVAAPSALTEKQVFAVDQFLMRGGTVVLGTSPLRVDMQRTLAAEKQASGLDAWLTHHGITIDDALVLDEQSAALPIPRPRRIGDFVVEETQLLDYPYFVDVRGDGIDQESGLAGGVTQVTMTWASPIALDEEKQGERTVVRLLESSPRSWSSESLDLLPRPEVHGELGFPVRDPQAPQLLAAVVEGRFESYFRGKDSPLLRTEEDAGAGDAEADEGEPAKPEDDPELSRVIDRSPESARIIVFASNTFFGDDMLELASIGLRTNYLSPVQLVENAIDWSLEDRGLLAIRGRAQFSRTLDPMPADRQAVWEYANYGAAAAGLLILWLLRARVERSRQLRYAAVLSGARA
jgi:ABC-2 type transport system permease protein